MKLSQYRDTCTRGRWSDPRARLNELRILFARTEARFLVRMGWGVPTSPTLRRRR